MAKIQNITLNDIAKVLNVSKVTISKALRNHPDISIRMKDLIKKTAIEMGYSPNFVARNLSAKKTNTIGLVVPKIAHFFFGSVIEAIYDAAFENNYEIILTVTQENQEKENKYIQSLLSMRVDGIIISITQNTVDCSMFESIREKEVPIVFLDRVVECGDFSCVTVEDYAGSYKATEHAIKMGYTKLAHFAGPKEINISRERYRGFVNALTDNNIRVNEEWIIHGGYSDVDGYNALMKLAEAGNLPEFIFTVTYPVALGVYAAAQKLGLKISQDIDVICFGDSDVNRFISPSLSCVYQPTEKLGREAVKMILEQINNYENYNPVKLELPTDLVIRETCSKKRITVPG